MRYGIIEPRRMLYEHAEAANFETALVLVGLKAGAVDFGTLAPGVGIVVGEDGLFVPPRRQHYFAISTRLYAGPAVLFGHNERGLTIDFDAPDIGKALRWFPNATAVEIAIAAGTLERPRVADEFEVYWQWPAPRDPAAFARRDARIQAALAQGRQVRVDDDTTIKVIK